MKGTKIDGQRILRAAECIAVAVAGGSRPVLDFSPIGLELVDVRAPGSDRVEHGQIISVVAPDPGMAPAKTEGRAACRVRAAVVAHGYRTLRFARFSDEQFRRAVSVVAAAGERLRVPSNWVAFRVDDLSEVTQAVLTNDSPGLQAGDVYWVLLDELPRDFRSARAAALRLLLKDFAEAADPMPPSAGAKPHAAQETRMAA